MLILDSSLVSIIMPSYNSAHFIEESIQSIINQTHQNWELLVTDDFSADNTIQIIENLTTRDSRIKLFKLKHNNGAAVARNHSIKHAKGRFIAFCDSDDLWEPSKLKEQVAFMIREDCAFSYTSYDRINEDGTSRQGIDCKSAITHKDLLKNNYIGCLTAMYDVEKLGKRYMPLLRKRQDWALWLQLLKECDEAKGLQERLAVYRERSSSMSSNKMEMLKYNWLIYHQVEGSGRVKATFQLFLFMIYYIQKKLED